MANPNHDERGRFSSGDGVMITGGQFKGQAGKIKSVGTSGIHIVQVPTVAGKFNVPIHESHLTKDNAPDTSPGGKATERLKAFHEKMQDPAYHAAREARMREKDAKNAELKLTTRKDAAAIGKLRKLNAAAGRPTDYGTLNRKLKRIKAASKRAVNDENYMGDH